MGTFFAYAIPTETSALHSRYLLGTAEHKVIDVIGGRANATPTVAGRTSSTHCQATGRRALPTSRDRWRRSGSGGGRAIVSGEHVNPECYELRNSPLLQHSCLLLIGARRLEGTSSVSAITHMTRKMTVGLIRLRGLCGQHSF